ncbi:hypothetical protein SXCC_02554 [Gluconacetobacter sp. SXCC-1]|uniref:Uncharacterized protein n=1 Tax=Komagataeibacter rhaeticus TaxID=215221 RepID=A0A181CAM2_9PROT|nr:hypothetical protein [Komagataeibacter rhaeticus]ATU72909.1 hypothetical protein CT154_08700 [Komagataeibacter xylinus]EGG76630.1 hypothetical protein SXCC_02554 [Gluconacetobacter sp. SXCC-1]QIP35343.1 hypothetical protein GWK63_07585 [Komagataeibacter rhaeticus]QOC47911.1 hypothetical protein ICJ78_07645 [Komagataeibacter rhaeticus]WPP22709.1 hypothetical protein SCD25_04240 [Komagataeibacter rhaeticus]
MSLALMNAQTAIGSVGRLWASAPVIIGGLTLTGMEVPRLIRDGGGQQVAVHRLPGGNRILDAVGNDPDRLELEGTFVGPTALARAQALKQMRVAGTPVAFSGAGLSLVVRIVQYSYDYQHKGVVIPYRLVLEQPAQVAASQSGTTSALSALIGADGASALSGITDALGDVSTIAGNVAGQLSTVVGQVTPVADMVGAGGVFATVQDSLGTVGGLSGAGVNLASTPQGATSLLSGLEASGAGLTSAISATGANLEGTGLTGAAGLSTLTQNAELHGASVMSGALVNRAYANTLTATGATQDGPLVTA